MRSTRFWQLLGGFSPGLCDNTLIKLKFGMQAYTMHANLRVGFGYCSRAVLSVRQQLGDVYGFELTKFATVATVVISNFTLNILYGKYSERV